MSEALRLDGGEGDTVTVCMCVFGRNGHVYVSIKPSAAKSVYRTQLNQGQNVRGDCTHVHTRSKLQGGETYRLPSSTFCIVNTLLLIKVQCLISDPF